MASTPPAFDLACYVVTDRHVLARGVGPSDSTAGGSVAASEDDLVAAVTAAVRPGGATCVQLREKSLGTLALVRLARRLGEVCRAAGVPLLINDRVDVALAAGQDVGVHLGQDDLPLSDARRLLGRDRLIGITVESPEQAVAAYCGGADYLGTSAVFATPTKEHPHGLPPLGPAGLAAILQAVADEERKWRTEGRLPPERISYDCPVVAIGGISATNVVRLFQDVDTALDASSSDSKTTSDTVAAARGSLAGVAVVSAILADADPERAASSLASLVRPLVAARRRPPLNPQTPLSEPAVKLLERVCAAVSRVRTSRPLVQNITNYVAMRVSADATLAFGGSPLMAHATDEAADIVGFVGALVINIGTLSQNWVAGMRIAAAEANKRDVPIVLDPVGAGATPFRMTTSHGLLTDFKVAILKGNQAEVAALLSHHHSLQPPDVGADAATVVAADGAAQRGVDSAGDLADPCAVARAAARAYSTVACMTGPVDHISDGQVVVRCYNGHARLSGITATGCTAAALAGCLAAVSPDDPLAAAVGAVLVLGVAAERAVSHPSGNAGPASFRVALFDALEAVGPDSVAKLARLDVVS
ncbi:hypothetical protein HK405_008620 [Cladochytrium tenue]|nr:hypothetical protein HK405_008620 [Cladochytrium tenue]